jgi:hypothetical protein
MDNSIEEEIAWFKRQPASTIRIITILTWLRDFYSEVLSSSFGHIPLQEIFELFLLDETYAHEFTSVASKNINDFGAFKNIPSELLLELENEKTLKELCGEYSAKEYQVEMFTIAVIICAYSAIAIKSVDLDVKRVFIDPSVEQSMHNFAWSCTADASLWYGVLLGIWGKHRDSTAFGKRGGNRTQTKNKVLKDWAEIIFNQRRHELKLYGGTKSQSALAGHMVKDFVAYGNAIGANPSPAYSKKRLEGYLTEFLNSEKKSTPPTP